ncbi:hypothetical protein KDA_76820 [Dictyobacter alpinus]|uniref:Uncharacterized protein n=2 Tax=Dictyobacter alpinus TaxID=2014873 RepID=A0A402BLF1_9CHLR|nr:hypothetical protein KDA_76820 [Dictyobacter alpinus]
MPTDFFLSSLQQAAPEHTVVQAQTLSPWTKLHLVRKGFKHVEYHSFAEVLLARMIDQRGKGWLPSARLKEEPHMWVYYQAPPSLYVDGEWIEQPIQVIPYPLIEDMGLVPSGILWSPWEGLMLDDWLHLPEMGAIRFFGQKRLYGRILWDISFDDLARWGIEPDPQLGTIAQSEEGRQYLAHKALLDLAIRKFTK